MQNTAATGNLLYFKNTSFIPAIFARANCSTQQTGMKFFWQILLFISTLFYSHLCCAQNNVSTKLSSADSVLVSTIFITGNSKTKDYIILRELPFTAGTSISRQNILQQLTIAKQQLINTSLFIDINVTTTDTTASFIAVQIDVKERWYLLPIPYFKLVDRNFNQWWVEQNHSLKRVNYGLKLIQNNVTGRNDNAYLWLITGYNHQVAFRYERPFADKSLKHGFSAGFSYSRQREVNYATDLQNKQLFYRGDDFLKKQLRIEASYLYRPAIKTRHSFTIKLLDEKIADTVYNLNRNYFPAGKKHITYPIFNYTLQYFNADNNIYPTRGFIGDFMFTKKGLGEDMNLWQVEFHSKYTLPIYKKTQLQLQAAGILNAPFKQPFFNNQIINYGDIFQRGLEYYVIDGVAGGVGRATLRNEIFKYTIKNPASIKNHNQIPVRFYLKAYADAGYVYSDKDNFSPLNNRLNKTWGVGLDIVTIYDIVLRLEYSFNKFGDQTLYIHSRADY